MTIYYSDESERLTPEITALMEKAADTAVASEFRAELEAAGITPEDTGAELSVTIVDGPEIRELNRDYRGIDRVTDVLSFPQFADREELADALTEGADEVLVGDVVICYDQALAQAEEYGTGTVRELVYLFVHSIFHLFGYDHEDEEERRVMRAREEDILTSIGVSR